MTGLIMLLKPALLTKDGMRSHQRCPEQGWSLLCNGVVLSDDGGQLLPDGRAISPASTCTAAAAPIQAPCRAQRSHATSDRS